MKIGIPRALLYYRYHVLWNTFFQELGIETVISPHTNKTLMDAGSHYAIDENCLSSKLFFGHVSALEGKAALAVKPEETLRVLRVIECIFQSAQNGVGIRCDL